MPWGDPWRSQDQYLDTCDDLCKGMDPSYMLANLPCLQAPDRDVIRAKAAAIGRYQANLELLERLRSYGERGFEQLGQALLRTEREDLSRRIGYRGSAPAPAASNAVPRETSDLPSPQPGPPPMRNSNFDSQNSSGGASTVNVTINTNNIANTDNVQVGDGGRMDVAHTVPNSNPEPGFDVVSEADSAERAGANDGEANGVDDDDDDDDPDDPDNDADSNNRRGDDNHSSPSTPQRVTQRDPSQNASVLPSGASRNATENARNRDVIPQRESVRPNVSNMNGHLIEEKTDSEDEWKKCDSDDEEEEEEEEKKINNTMETQLTTNSIEDNKSLNASLPSTKVPEGVPDLPIFRERLHSEENDDEDDEDDTCLLKCGKQKSADSMSDIEEDGCEFSLESAPEASLSGEPPSFVPASRDRDPAMEYPQETGDHPEPAVNPSFFNSGTVKYFVGFTFGILATVLFLKIVKR